MLGFETRLQVLLHLADGLAEELGGPEHGGGLFEGLQLAGLGIGHPLGQDAERHLGHRQIARSGHRQHSLARDLVDAQLAIGRDVVEPGVGARVGEHHQALLDENSCAIGHVLASGTCGRGARRPAYA